MTSLKEYIAFLETLNEAAALYNEHMVWVSPKFLELFGYSSLDEVKGTSIYSYNYPDELIDQQKNIEARRQSPQFTSGVWNFRRKDGSYIKFHSNGSVVALDGETYYVAIGRNYDDIQEPQYTSGVLKHETLTPLTVAQGYLEIIEDRIQDPDTVRLLTQAKANLYKLSETIQKFVKDSQQFNRIDE